MTDTVILARDLPARPAAMQVAGLRLTAAERGLRVKAAHEVSARRIRTTIRAMLGRPVPPPIIMVESVPVLGRTDNELATALAAVHAAGVKLIVAGVEDEKVNAMLTAAPLLLRVRAALAREALLAGRQRARRLGVKFGRPALSADRVARVHDALASGAGVRQAARIAGVSAASVIRLRDSRARGETVDQVAR